MDVDDLAQPSDVWPGDGCRERIDHDRKVTVDVAGGKCLDDNVQPDRVEEGDGGQIDHDMRPAILDRSAERVSQDRRRDQVHAAG